MTKAWKEKKAREGLYQEAVEAYHKQLQQNQWWGIHCAPAGWRPYPGPKFRFIYADAAWNYQNYGMKGHGAVRAHYPTMTVQELCDLQIDIGYGLYRVWDYADPAGCVLGMWGTSPKVEECMTVMRSWGFPCVTKLFCWVKTYNDGSNYCGLGNYTRSGTEDCWMGRIGKNTAQSRNERQLLELPEEQKIRSPVREHSRKPDECYERIEGLFGPACGQYLEMFSRSSRRGWVSWGYDAGKFGVVK